MSDKAKKQTRRPRGPLWTREETMMAFNLYSKMPYGKIHDYHPDIVNLAAMLNRPAASVSMKMCNLATLDPAHKDRIKGLRIAKVEREVWAEFHANPGAFMRETEGLLRVRQGAEAEGFDLEPDIADLPQGEVRRRLVNTRAHQGLFRKMVLSAYDNRCCMTGIAAAELLNASHIVPWRENPNERTNPRNGLCLNALHDRAFDRGLISVSPDFVVHISAKLRDMAESSDKARFITETEGKPITLPTRFTPDKDFLTHHYRNIFQR